MRTYRVKESFVVENHIGICLPNRLRGTRTEYVQFDTTDIITVYVQSGSLGEFYTLDAPDTNKSAEFFHNSGDFKRPEFYRHLEELTYENEL